MSILRRFGGTPHEVGTSPAARALVATALALLPLFLHSGIVRRSTFVQDEAWMVLHAKAFAEGAIPHVEVFDILLSGSYLPLSLLFVLFGAKIVVARLFALAVLGAIAATGFVATARSAPVVASAAAWGAFLVWSGRGAFFSFHWMFCLASLATLLYVTRAFSRGEAPDPFRLGLLLGVAITIAWSRSVPLALALLLVVLLLRGEAAPARGAAARVALLAAGALLPVALLVGAFTLADSRYPGEMLRQTVLFALNSYAGSATIPLASLFAGIGFSDPVAAARGVARLVCAFLPPVAVVLFAIARLRPSAARPEPRTLALALFAGAGWLSSLNRPDEIHFTFSFPLALPFLLDRIGALSRDGGRLGAGLRIAAVAVGITALPLARQDLRRGGQFEVPVASRTGALLAARSDASLPFLGRLLDRIPPGESLVAIPYIPSWYLLLGATNASRYFFLVPGYQPDAQVEEVAAVIERGGARFVLLDEAQFADPFLASFFPKIDRVRVAAGRARLRAAIDGSMVEVDRWRSLRLFERRPTAP